MIQKKKLQSGAFFLELLDESADVLLLEAGVLTKLFKGDELVWALAEMDPDFVKE